MAAVWRVWAQVVWGDGECGEMGRIEVNFKFNVHNSDSLLPTPYSLLPTPYSLLPTPYSLLPNNNKDFSVQEFS
ncbi:MAG: hypothetical protein F6J94_05220 [Moorea sp. SIO1F2]|uniref:hypothetical protein n=2 Tax=Moorena TaxID=1155738 RepID=UPI0013BBBCDF|nr:MULTISPECIES: hypothetical protein [unclassified Moorena]NEQ56319.1 hypothetical protein [Moorena sp. SIO4A1]NET81374.1 hypothetical protein [Moorena sp. SIO1F2]